MNAEVISEDELEMEDRRWEHRLICITFERVNNMGERISTYITVNDRGGNITSSNTLRNAMVVAKAQQGSVFRSGTGSFVMEIALDGNEDIVIAITILEARSLKISTIGEGLQADPASPLALRIKVLLTEA